VSHRLRALRATTILLALAAPAQAQTFRTADTVVRRIWTEGMERSQTERLAQVLMDSIGPRLSGTSGFQSAVDWLASSYAVFGVTARQERYGVWRGWRNGATHMELIAPRLASLEVKLLAWSPGTERDVDGDAVVLPSGLDSAAATRWLGTARGKYVLVSAPEVMCRAPREFEQLARAATVTRLQIQRQELQRDAAVRARAFGGGRVLQRRLDSAGVAGIVTSNWSGGWGVNKIFSATATRVPTVDLSCEDYGLVWRLASNNQGPRLRLHAEAEMRPDQPMFNVVAELTGTELPNEYVLLSAHLDSWHGATGATDNGTGTIMMLEAMRILHEAYPRPRRTILVGHWGAEEQGLVGSRAFAEDHPEVIQGLQVAFNQDNGTWRIEYLEGQGFLFAGASVARWIAQIPTELTDSLRLAFPGAQDNGGSDHSSFICNGVPGLRLQSSYPEYRQYTWHTNRDTYDKIVFDDLRNNATLVATLAYLASEDPERVPRDRSVLPPGPNGQPRAWAACPPLRRAPPER
jgi:hypothetical protein